MKYVGLIRGIDKLGRISFASEYLSFLNINNGDKVFIHKTGNEIHVSKKIIGSMTLCGMRNIDTLGRLVMPIKERRELDINSKGSKYEQLLTSDRIIIKKFI